MGQKGPHPLGTTSCLFVFSFHQEFFFFFGGGTFFLTKHMLFLKSPRVFVSPKRGG